MGNAGVITAVRAIFGNSDSDNTNYYNTEDFNTISITDNSKYNVSKAVLEELNVSLNVRVKALVQKLNPSSRTPRTIIDKIQVNRKQ